MLRHALSKRMHVNSDMRNKVSFILAISLAVLVLLPGSFAASVPTSFEDKMAQIDNIPKRHVKKTSTLNTVKHKGYGLPHLPVDTYDFQKQAVDPIQQQTLAGDDTQKGLDDAANKLSQLYGTIRNVALPKSGTHTQRLVMLLPGKVLSYSDYYPGELYESSLEHPDQKGRQVNIPVRVMENMFSLADAVPGIDPLHGAETGESMALIYEDILYWMQIKGFDDKTKEEKQRYLKAVEYLAQKVPDPFNVSVNITKFNLYRRSQDAYNAKRLEMEDIIATKRNLSEAPEFESWFQRNYPTLNAGVEAAYTEWLIFGEKEIVELYKSYLDVQTPGLDLEDARMALRASGVISLDRSRTVYPVSFVPSNWYRYLTDVKKVDEASKLSALSGDQIRLKIGELNAKRAMIEALKSAPMTTESKKAIDDAQKLKLSASTNLQDSVNKAEKNRQACVSNRGCNVATTTNVGCDDFTNSSDATSDSITQNSQIFACAASVSYQLNTTLQQAYYDQVIKGIDTSIKEYEKALSTSQVPLSQLAQHAADSKEQLDSEWMQFEFDSSKSSTQTDTSYSYSSHSISANVRYAWLSVSASYSTSKAEQDYRNQMNSAKVAVKGQLLRVTIQRPWFRPSIFRSDQFTMADNITVSPGDNLEEMDFVAKVLNSNKTYYLPHYSTGLLLSRNVSVEFREVSSSAVYHAIQQSSSLSAGVSANCGLWSVGVQSSSSWGSSSTHAKFEASETGLRITIPGVQIIGYYTQNVPKFPKS